MTAPLSGAAQSSDSGAPTPVLTNQISGRIAPRDLGDARLTRHFYTFAGREGDLMVTVESTGLDGDVDLFTAGNLRPLTKVTLYPSATAARAQKSVYLRSPEPLILRVEARSTGDTDGTYIIRLEGAFAPADVVAAAATSAPEAGAPPPAAAAGRGRGTSGRRVTSVGARAPETEEEKAARLEAEARERAALEAREAERRERAEAAERVKRERAAEAERIRRVRAEEAEREKRDARLRHEERIRNEERMRAERASRKAAAAAARAASQPPSSPSPSTSRSTGESNRRGTAAAPATETTSGAAPERPAANARRGRARANPPRAAAAAAAGARAEQPSKSANREDAPISADNSAAGKTLNRRTPSIAPAATTPARVQPFAGTRLIIETKDGARLVREMNLVRRVTIENDRIVIVGKDGKVERQPTANVIRMSIEP